MTVPSVCVAPGEQARVWRRASGSEQTGRRSPPASLRTETPYILVSNPVIFNCVSRNWQMSFRLHMEWGWIKNKIFKKTFRCTFCVFLKYKNVVSHCSWFCLKSSGKVVLVGKLQWGPSWNETENWQGQYWPAPGVAQRSQHWVKGCGTMHLCSDEPNSQKNRRVLFFHCPVGIPPF